MAQRISGLTDHLGFRARQVSNHVSAAFAQKLAARDTSVAEWVMLRMLHGAAPAAPSLLAEDMGMTRGGVTKLADRLIARGLIARTASTEDKRTQTLALTAKGQALVPELAELADLNDAECFGHLSDEDRATLKRVLADCAAALGLAANPIH